MNDRDLQLPGEAGPKRPELYLCGGINGLDDDEAKGWRVEAKRTLSDLWIIHDPMDRDFRGQEAANVDDIVNGDLADILPCHALLVNARRPSWGTAMEVVYAFRSGSPQKRIISFGVDPSKASPWLTYHSHFVLATLDEGIERAQLMAKAMFEALNDVKLEAPGV